MPEREYDSDAERQRAYRERKRAESLAKTETSEQETRDRFGYAKSETRTKAERDAVAARITGRPETTLDEEEYVRRIVAEALAYSKQIGETDAETKIGDNVFTNRRSDRLRRAERYARWRWAGYHSGEIASL